MQVRPRLTDHLLDLSQEQIDLALRVAEMTNSNAIVRKLAPNRRMVVASPAYLERHGTPKEPVDLLKHNCLSLRFAGSPQFRWTLQTPDGPVTLRVAGNMEADNSEVLRDWCVAGHGLALDSLWEIVEELNTGRTRGSSCRHSGRSPTPSTRSIRKTVYSPRAFAYSSISWPKFMGLDRLGNRRSTSSYLDDSSFATWTFFVAIFCSYIRLFRSCGSTGPPRLLDEARPTEGRARSRVASISSRHTQRVFRPRSAQSLPRSPRYEG